MSGTIIVTGSNGSLAINAVRYLLTHAPEYTLVLTVRNASDEDPNTKALHNVLAQHSKQTHASIRQLDLSHLGSVHEFAQNIANEISKGDLPPLVSIVCNAYYWNLSRPMEITANDGFEKTFQITHLAHVALVLRLLGSFHPQHAGRIVLFSSDAIFPGKNGLEKIPPSIPDNLDLLAHPPPDAKNDNLAYGFQRYANTKLTVVMWTHALNRRLEKDSKLRHITAVAIHPGSLSDSRALRVNTPAMVQYLSKIVIRPLRPLLRIMDPTIRTSAEAGKDVARLAINEASPDERGYFTLLEKDESSPDSLNEQKQEQLWLQSAQWVGITAQDTALGAAFT
ncbi:Retinol dehydrogenase 13 [Cytospora mali]|uniref:Retinol dehydrogenase 13 n=1 Tax=Cytospora mali TaxID=578113 RepID=A0A194WBD8_CYTMA|nr:Retinol dehydrogenase 13 [Valsa mali]